MHTQKTGLIYKNLIYFPQKNSNQQKINSKDNQKGSTNKRTTHENPYVKPDASKNP